MSGFSPRRGSGMNQYIANLNTIPASGEGAVSETAYPGLDDELSLFTNVEFLNEFDLGDSVDGGEALGSAKSANTDGNFDDGFNFPYMAGEPVNGIPFGVPYTPTSVGHPSHYPPSASTSGPQIGEKRPASAANSSSPDGESRLAAEEDKRRRNTAASARFRVKKKQREQALERTAKEMTERSEKLEARVTELEQENKFLRSLVVEKAGGDKGAEDVLRKVADDARKADSSKKGVGTKAE